MLSTAKNMTALNLGPYTSPCADEGMEHQTEQKDRQLHGRCVYMGVVSTRKLRFRSSHLTSATGFKRKPYKFDASTRVLANESES